MAPKYHPTPLSGGDHQALAKELDKARTSGKSRLPLPGTAAGLADLSFCFSLKVSTDQASVVSARRSERLLEVEPGRCFGVVEVTDREILADIQFRNPPPRVVRTKAPSMAGARKLRHQRAVRRGRKTRCILVVASAAATAVYISAENQGVRPVAGQPAWSSLAALRDGARLDSYGICREEPSLELLLACRMPRSLRPRDDRRESLCDPPRMPMLRAASLTGVQSASKAPRSYRHQSAGGRAGTARAIRQSAAHLTLVCRDRPRLEHQSCLRGLCLPPSRSWLRARRPHAGHGRVSLQEYGKLHCSI